jgi:hypothetical protein
MRPTLTNSSCFASLAGLSDLASSHRTEEVFMAYGARIDVGYANIGEVVA